MLGITYPVQQRLSTLRQQAFNLPAFKALPRFERRWQRPLLQLHQRITKGGGAELVDAHQQGAGIVLAGGQVRGVDQRVDRHIEVSLLAQDRTDAVLTQGGPHTIAEQ